MQNDTTTHCKKLYIPTKPLQKSTIKTAYSPSFCFAERKRRNNITTDRTVFGRVITLDATSVYDLSEAAHHGQKKIKKAARRLGNMSKIRRTIWLEATIRRSSSE